MHLPRTFLSNKLNMWFLLRVPHLILISCWFFATWMTTGFAHAAEAIKPHAATDQHHVIVENAWVRTTNPGQNVGAAYMTLTSAEDLALTSVESSASESVEIHSMSMQSGVMKMRMLNTLTLRKNKPYKLEPGGFHFMLFDLKRPLMEGTEVSFTLQFKTLNSEKPNTFKQSFNVKVMSATPAH